MRFWETLTTRGIEAPVCRLDPSGTWLKEKDPGPHFTTIYVDGGPKTSDEMPRVPELVRDAENLTGERKA